MDSADQAADVERAAPAKRYRAYTGIVTTPRYFDDSPQQFLAVAPDGVGAIQRVMHVPGYEFGLEQRAQAFDIMEESAACLAACHCQVIGQVGSNWVHCGGATPDEIRDFCDRIGAKYGAPFLMAGLCLVDALRALGAKRIAVANSYYRDSWRDGINRFLIEAGFEILWSGNMIDQGMYGSLAEMEAVEAATHWDYPAADVVEACRRAHLAAPEADAVVQTGAGFRAAPNAAAIEAQIGKPLVASDLALYWAMLKTLDIGPARPGFGRLLETLG